MALVRLQKYLSECGVASRRKAEELIAGGSVEVNGEVVSVQGIKIKPGADQVRVHGRLVRMEEKGVLLLNKPKGVVSSLSDPQGRRDLGEFLTKQTKSYFPVGRLDYHSTGLVILTNDGQLAQRLSHPKYEIERKYKVRVEGVLPKRVLKDMGDGLKLEDGVVTAKAKIISKSERSTWIEVLIHQGKNRIIRRMMEHLGYPVLKLQRISHGPFKLGKLRIGQIRQLSDKEYHRQRAKIMIRR